jgi:hypothetical protein
MVWGRLKDVEFSIPKENHSGSFLGINTARLYEAYANKETEKYADLRTAWLLIVRFRKFSRLPSKGSLHFLAVLLNQLNMVALSLAPQPSNHIIIS